MTTGLLERDEELDVLETALRRAATGSGSVVLRLDERTTAALGIDTTGATP